MPDSLQPGFTVSGETDGRWPLILTSPHSGREYPPAFLAAARLSPAQLRRAEDPLVDELLEGITDVPVLRARFARAYLDLNRGADELDPAMFDGPLPMATKYTDRVAAGLGVVPRVAGQGLDIYRRRLAVAEAESRLHALHHPWHSRIATLITRARARHGYAILLDCHSMPPPQGAMAPQIILGDRHGTSASPALVGLVETHFRAAGWRVGRNNPYAGGHTTEFHASPADGVHTLQIEIDRSLYLEPARFSRSRQFATVAAHMTSLVAAITAAAPMLDLGPRFREAAE